MALEFGMDVSRVASYSPEKYGFDLDLDLEYHG